MVGRPDMSLGQGYKQVGFFRRVYADIRKHPMLYVIIAPVILYYLLFCYKPMYGALIAFTNYRPGSRLLSNWIGFANFRDFFHARDFKRLIENTITISLNSIFWGFPAPILLALLMNELRSRRFARVVQTISYMPHFISMVVMCGMITSFVSSSGVITQSLLALRVIPKPISLLSKAPYFVPIYVISGIWQEVGYGSIIYLAALTGVSAELYEAATIDGANRWKQTLHVTLPGILPTIITMLILRMGAVMSVGSEKIILLYNAATYSTADVISSYVYRKGIQSAQYSFSTAVGLFNSVINCAMLILVNAISRRLSETSLW
ncbi:MAG TPA: ABC transporter permease subunit [Clostridia bacterium]|nr:ABC transporter permease subunit [Clostridia bacterium]